MGVNGLIILLIVILGLGFAFGNEYRRSKIDDRPAIEFLKMDIMRTEERLRKISYQLNELGDLEYIKE